jgi:hypothetical protein
LVAIATGALLWYLLHRGSEAISEQVLTTGAVFALIAGGIQAVTGVAGRQVLARAGNLEGSHPQNRVVTGQRIAAGCLAVTIICMAASRYV